MSKFTATWDVEDGYVNSGRSHSFYVSAFDLSEDMTDEEIVDLLNEQAEDHFRERVNYALRAGTEAAFIAWAREQLAKRRSA